MFEVYHKLYQRLFQGKKANVREVSNTLHSQKTCQIKFCKDNETIESRTIAESVRRRNSSSVKKCN